MDRALRHACFAVDAVLGIDKQHLLAFVEAVAGTDNDTVSVLAAETRFRNDKGHDSLLN
jgi:hypothetical protein